MVCKKRNIRMASLVIAMFLLFNVWAYAEVVEEENISAIEEIVQEKIINPITDQEISEKLSIKLTVQDSISPNECIQAIIELSDVSEARQGSYQWFQDGVGLTNGYCSDFLVADQNYAIINIPIEFYQGMPSSTLIRFELHINGHVRAVEKTVALHNYSDEHYKNINIERVFRTIKPVSIGAVVRYGTTTYSSASLKNSTGYLNAGTNVIYMGHNGGRKEAKIWYNNSVHWVPYTNLTISDKNYTIFSDYEQADKVTFVNAKGYESKTKYLVWINLERQKVNVFVGEKGNWELIKEFTCATGKNITPTPADEYEHTLKMDAWKHTGYYVKPIVYFHTGRGFAMHSRTYKYNGTLLDATMGTPASNGCVRMLDEDIQWVWANIPLKTKVVVF